MRSRQQIQSKLINHHISKSVLNSKYPVVRQYDQIDCGPAALLSVLKFWGGNSSLVHVRELANTDAQGSNMLGLVNAAKELGFEAVGASGDYEDLMQETMPCIAHVILENQLQHFVIIYKIDAKGVLIGDPAKGVYKLSKEKFIEIWRQRAVILLTPNGELFENKTPNWLHWVFAYFKKEESWLYQSIFLGILYTLFGLLVAVFVQWLVDRFIPERDTFKIIITGVFLLVLQLLRALAGYLRQRFLVELNRRVNINVNKDFLSHIFQLPLRFFDTRKKGDITARINDGIKIQQAVLRILGITIIDGLIIFGSFAFLFILAPTLGWIVLTTLPLYALILALAAKSFKAEQNEVMKSYAQVESFYFDSLNGINEILSYHVSSAFARLNKFFFEKFQQQTAKLGLTQARISLYAELAAGALVVGVLSFGAILVIQKSLLLGQMIAAYSLLANMLPAVNRLVEANILLQGASIAVQRLMDLLLVETEKNAGKLPFKLNESLIIKDIQFTWPKGQELLRGVNLAIPKGQITSLWGISGSGKSTLVKIVQRQYALSDGQIFADCRPIGDFELLSYRRNIAVVPQEVKIFNGTILENIQVGREGVDSNRILKRVEQLGLAAFLSRFEHGLLTLVGEEGRQLSGGEMQFLALIRALVESPAVLILDEGISAIDVEIEHFIFKVVRDYSKNHAVLLITHNLQTIIKTDTVYLLEDGVITQSGPPHELLRSHNRFKNLWNIQNNTTRELKFEGSANVI